MAIIEDILAPIAVVSGVGGAIDFYLGSAGQRRVKKWLEDKWYRFHDVDWHNFSEREAQYFIQASPALYLPPIKKRSFDASTVLV